MIYSEMVRKASVIMFDAHKEDLDKGGYPYVMHPLHLAEQMEDEDSACVSLLHDVIEDHGDRYPLAALAAEGFSDNVLAALRLLTHTKGTPYMDYVKAIAENPIARKVKMADLRHNMDDTRTGGVKAPKYALYQEALAYLQQFD